MKTTLCKSSWLQELLRLRSATQVPCSGWLPPLEFAPPNTTNSTTNHMGQIIRVHSKGMAFLLFSLAISVCPGCYSLKGYSISPDVQTYYVGNFKLTALNAPATITQTFAESLKDKISKESRLKYSDKDPHIEFNGTIQGFNVSSVAPQPGETTAFNRLTINLSIEYTNNLDPKDQWTKSFTHFDDFPSDQNLLQVQDDLIEVIFNQILEDIFNQAFNNW